MDLQLVPPIDQQHPWESRRVWNPVISQMLGGKYSEATKVKRQVEEDQRQREKILKNQVLIFLL
jgi:hypothetical protein